MKNIIEIINSIDSESAHVNPTEIYNEGWMTRLLVSHSINDKIELNGLNFGHIKNWTAEALISSPFIKAEYRREGYTHADMAIGDFKVDYKNRGEIMVDKKAELFGIIEAKMGSNLSQRTKHANDYNQASRNIACIANQTHSNNCQIFFAVVAPEKALLKHKIESQIDKENIINQIEMRFSAYPDSFKENQYMKSIIRKVQSCNIWSVSYEQWIDKFKPSVSKDYLIDFYHKSKKWNRLN